MRRLLSRLEDSYFKIVYLNSSSGDGQLHRVNVEGTEDVILDKKVNIPYNSYYIRRQPRFYDSGNKIGYVSRSNIRF